MKIKISRLVDINNILVQISDKKIGIKTAYKIAKFKEAICKDIDFYNNKFSEIISEYAQKENGKIVYSEDKTSILIVPGKEEECLKLIQDLRDLEVDINITPFNLEDFNDIDFTVNQVETLFPIIE